jgi:spore coat polysaccharide biosynthesis predicted glycosyltransferase SpsG
MTTSPTQTRLVLRADGNSRIGLGHVMRLLALADILREQFGCVFVIQEPDAVLLTQLRESCSEVATASNSATRKLCALTWLSWFAWMIYTLFPLPPT